MNFDLGDIPFRDRQELNRPFFTPFLFEKARTQVQVKYDLWQQSLELEYANILLRHMHLIHAKISDARSSLENISLLEGTTSELVAGVTLIEQISQIHTSWEQEVCSLQESERLLKKHRHNFAVESQSAWMESSRVRGQYNNLEQILCKRKKIMLDSMPVLQQRIVVEDNKHKNRMIEVIREWETLRPLRGNINPGAALETLANLEVKLRLAADDGVKLEKAKSVLSLATNLSGEVGAVNDALEELSDIREVWKSVTDPFAKLQIIRDTLWINITPRKIRLSLEELLKDLRSLPNRVRQYDAYTHMFDAVKQLVNGNSVLSDLKTDALKPVSQFYYESLPLGTSLLIVFFSPISASLENDNESSSNQYISLCCNYWTALGQRYYFSEQRAS